MCDIVPSILVCIPLLCIVIATPCQYYDDSLVIDCNGGWNALSECLKDKSAFSIPTIQVLNHGNGPLPYGIFAYAAQASGHSFETTNLIFKKAPGTRGLGKLDPYMFRVLRRLRSLDISDQGITDISIIEDALFGLNRLRVLNLNGNSLFSIAAVSQRYPHSFPRLEVLHLEGSSIEEGCIPGSLKVVPEHLLPPCSASRLIPFFSAPPEYESKHLREEYFQSFPCDTYPELLQREIFHVYEIADQTNHYGLVFVFQGGMMISELYYKNKVSIHRTCTLMSGLDHDIRSSALDFRRQVEVFYSTRCTQCRKVLRMSNPSLSLFSSIGIPPVLSDAIIHDISGEILGARAFKYLNMGDWSLTIGDVTAFSDRYTMRHLNFQMGSINSCITYSHVLFRTVASIGPIEIEYLDPY